MLTKTRKYFLDPRLLIGFICFAIHFGLVFHHTYFDASRKNTRTFPPAPMRLMAYAPTRWHNFLDLNRWDSAHYEKIVLQGYRDPDTPGKPLRTIGWYPGYPLLAKCLLWITGWKVTFIFSVLSVLFTLAFWLVLWSPRIVSFFGIKVVTTASIFILTWPGAFFWFAGMTEPLVGFFMVMLLYLWIRQSFNGIVVLLCYATSVKQVFVPVTIALFTIEILRSHPKPSIIISKALMALTGFVGFGVYCWIHFGNFFMPAKYQIAGFKKGISLFSLIDLSHYAKFIWTTGGITAFTSMFFLLITALRISKSWNSWKEIPDFFRLPQRDLSIELVLWWLALACTTFFVLGNAYASRPYLPFMSLMRFQTVNIPFILLLALQFRKMDWWQIFPILIPISWVFLYWQNIFTLRYWFWKWVS